MLLRPRGNGVVEALVDGRRAAVLGRRTGASTVGLAAADGRGPRVRRGAMARMHLRSGCAAWRPRSAICDTV